MIRNLEDDDDKLCWRFILARRQPRLLQRLAVKFSVMVVALSTQSAKPGSS